jgi:hypothetical protein
MWWCLRPYALVYRHHRVRVRPRAVAASLLMLIWNGHWMLGAARPNRWAAYPHCLRCFRIATKPYGVRRGSCPATETTSRAHDGTGLWRFEVSDADLRRLETPGGIQFTTAFVWVNSFVWAFTDAPRSWSCWASVTLRCAAGAHSGWSAICHLARRRNAPSSRSDYMDAGD